MKNLINKIINSIFIGIFFILTTTFVSCKNNNSEDILTITDNLPNISGYPIVDTNQSTFLITQQ